MRIDFEITYRGETVNLDETASQMVVSFTIYDGNFPNGGSGAVDSVNGKTGTVVLNAGDIAETSSRVWLTPTLKADYDNAVSALPNKADLVNGLVPASQLPAYVDDVLEYANLASFPTIGANGKIYMAIDTNKTYRWTGSTYAPLDEGVVLGETSSTAGRGDWVKAVYDWFVANATSLVSHLSNTSNPHNVTASQVGAYTTTQVDTALALKANKTDVQVLIGQNTSNVTLSGTSSETILFSILIRANTLSAGDTIAFRNLLQRTTYTGQLQLKMRVSEAQAPSPINSATLLAIYNASNIVQFVPFERNRIHIESSSQWIVAVATASVNDDSVPANLSTLSIDTTKDQYIHITGTHPTSTDVAILHSSKLIKL